ISKMEEFLPMSYFDVRDDGKDGNKEDGESDDTLDNFETMGLWYEMMIDLGDITLLKAEWKEEKVRINLKIENYTKACKLFLVGLEGLSQVYEDQNREECKHY